MKDKCIPQKEWNTNYRFIFVHGLSGWGHYDFVNNIFPYFGQKNGSTVKYLNKKGFDCYEASVAPKGSTWDRTCELYAQLTGTVTDYGKAHSAKYNHPRYGKDFSRHPLVDKWDSVNKLNFIGHSFGGTTIRLLIHLMANGSAEEAECTPKEELSGLFTGNKADWIYAAATFATPHRGTSAYHVKDNGPDTRNLFEKFLEHENQIVPKDGKAYEDHAVPEMHLPRAAELNRYISTVKSVYYFSTAGSAGVKDDNGNFIPDMKIVEKMCRHCSRTIGSFEGTTEDGMTFTSEWKENDGLVNTISAKAPEFAPSVIFNPQNIERGVWNIMPVVHQDHMGFQGGQLIRKDINNLYYNQLDLINRL